MIASLAVLVGNMSSLPLTSQVFDTTLMNSKGKFPYDFAVSSDILENTHHLPIKEDWKDITDEEYVKAQLVWKKLECKTMLDYMLQYLKLDVFLLADVFECFRKKSLSDDGLEPLCFYGVPGMSWASALKSLKHKVELIVDPEIHSFFDKSKRGGMTFINKHHVESNDDQDLLYIDINNLYGLALSQKLPCGNFKMITENSELSLIMDTIKWNGKESENPLDGDIGYVVEVDIIIPKELHDKLDDLPVAPETGYPPNSTVKKLMLTHKPKYNYVVHAKLLQFWLSLKIKVTKIHRAVQFDQKCVFADYVDLNTRKRAAATNAFDKDYYKLKNNSLYGKTVENLKNRINIRLCNTVKKLATYASSPFFRKSVKIDDDFVSVFLNKEEICLDRPSYIGMAVLDLSKLRMYQLEYRDLEHYRQELSCKINIIAGDTDSFFLQCEGVKINQLLLKMRTDGLLDTSNYPIDHELFSREYENKLGLFKDEAKGRRYKEWIFLRPKCYSLKFDDDKEKSEKLKAKGIILKDANLTHSSYKNVYLNNTVVRVDQRKIVSKNHQLFTERSKKKALQCLDNKRYWIGENTSLAYGHYNAPDFDHEDWLGKRFDLDDKA